MCIRDSEEAEELNLAQGKTAISPGQKINLNTAPRDVMMQLPGIGETIANRIIEGRPWKSIDALIEVDGIGDAKLEAIRKFLLLK